MNLAFVHQYSFYQANGARDKALTPYIGERRDTYNRHEYCGKAYHKVFRSRHGSTNVDFPRIYATPKKNYSHHDSSNYHPSSAAKIQSNNMHLRCDICIRPGANWATGVACRLQHLGQACVVHVSVGALARRLAWCWFAFGTNVALWERPFLLLHGHILPVSLHWQAVSAVFSANGSWKWFGFARDSCALPRVQPRLEW